MAAYLLSSLIFVISFSATLPQLYQTFATGKTRDLNQWNLILNLVTNILLAIHGANMDDLGLFGIGAWFSLYWSLLLGLKLYNVNKCEMEF